MEKLGYLILIEFWRVAYDRVDPMQKDQIHDPTDQIRLLICMQVTSIGV